MTGELALAAASRTALQEEEEVQLMAGMA